MCRGWGLNPRPQAYESCALPTELPRQNYKKSNQLSPSERMARSSGRATPTYLYNNRQLDIVACHLPTCPPMAGLLREAESNGRLKVMSLTRYLFSIPL